ncbi:hypothetical protein NPS01_25150 [Nocardioides psychrotolerans]|nr:hypothetical protein NPS01_25150 [Nocardioides psychrotolerans]
MRVEALAADVDELGGVAGLAVCGALAVAPVNAAACGPELHPLRQAALHGDHGDAGGVGEDLELGLAAVVPGSGLAAVEDGEVVDVALVRRGEAERGELQGAAVAAFLGAEADAAELGEAALQGER